MKYVEELLMEAVLPLFTGKNMSDFPNRYKKEILAIKMENSL
jgi:hypothetical protein